MNSTDDYIKVRVRATGRVQGVGFRFWTMKHAQCLGLGGAVSNMPDGSVEAVFCGVSGSVEEMILLCGRGSGYARVESLTILNREPASECPADFRILR